LVYPSTLLADGLIGTFQSDQAVCGVKTRLGVKWPDALNRPLKSSRCVRTWRSGLSRSSRTDPDPTYCCFLHISPYLYNQFPITFRVSFMLVIFLTDSSFSHKCLVRAPGLYCPPILLLTPALYKLFACLLNFLPFFFLSLLSYLFTSLLIHFSESRPALFSDRRS